ncbi:hypothetical protein RJT34_01324 [Clitoria ternatea]|uniref:Uncharacterized protein n=1 Tax=Clitoria ternatea TaxID=43366 RepID=A0AAN9KJE6_CLITE
MREFPSCFGETGVQVADSSSSSRAAQNVVTCVYQCKLRGDSCLITVSWTKTLMGQGLSVGIDDMGKVEIKPWLFSRRKGSKNLEVQSGKVDIFWDLTCAKFGSGPEPLEGFYLAVVFNKEMVLLLGDLKKEACNKIESGCGCCAFAHSGAVFVSKREHIVGNKFYGAKAQFCDKGQLHDVTIECDTVGLKDPSLVIRIDSKTVMQVKRLKWKFRGNHTILVDGVPVQVFWDVHSWLFGNAMGNAVFMFQTCISTDKFVAAQSVSDPSAPTQLQGFGFSLILYAWKHTQ